jgi:hypothetical protein
MSVISTVDFNDLGDGEFLERFNQLLAQVGENIQDESCSPTKARAITIKLTFRPDKSRRMIGVVGQMKATLAEQEGLETTLTLEGVGRTAQLAEYKSRNTEIDFNAIGTTGE